MRRPLGQFAVIAASLTLVAGCGVSQPPAQPEAQVAGSDVLFVVPARLATCEPGAVAVVRWNMRPAHPGITDIEIWTGPKGHQTLFAAGGYSGEASTVRPWAHPGTTFSLRNKADGAEVASVVIDGPACGG